MQMQYTKNLNPGRSELGTTFVGSSLEAELVSSKHIIQVNLEILSRSVENMASHWLAQYITWSKCCQSLR